MYAFVYVAIVNFCDSKSRWKYTALQGSVLRIFIVLCVCVCVYVCVCN